MKHFKFVKLSDRWFVDIPWDGDITDLEMVAGANTFLECYQKNGIVKCAILEDSDEMCESEIIHLIQTSCDDNGSFYDVKSELYRGEIWLCPVLKHVLGDYPKCIRVVFK